MIKVAKLLGLFLMITSSVAIAADKDLSSGVTTSATNDSAPSFEWTLERMLMATAMPMTGDERQFLQTHKNLDGIREWTYNEFKTYINEDLGKKHVLEEALHWQSNLKMLKQEATDVAASFHEPQPDCGKDASFLEGPTIQKMLKQVAGDDGAKRVFDSMQTWRQQIAVLAPYVESMRKRRTGAPE